MRLMKQLTKRCPQVISLAACGVVATLVLVAQASAAPPPGKGGGNGGGGGEDPPPDPAIAYVDPDGAVYDLMKMNDDGTNATLVLDDVDLSGAANGSSGRVSWSPDGTMIAFNSSVDGDGVYVVNADGTGMRKVASTSTVYLEPSWSPAPAPDGQYKIAFRDKDGVNGRRDIFLVNPDGTGLQNLTNTPDYHELDPTWNALATQLATTKRYWESAIEQVVVHDLGLIGGAVAILGTTDVTDLPGSPLQSAPGKQYLDWARTQGVIVLGAGEYSDEYDLWTIDLADPENPTQLTFTPDIGERHPTWSPDDSQLAFNQVAAGKKNDGIYRMNADGTARVRLVKGDSVAPDWKR